ncbi:universal stress protein [Salinarimonas ramus]|uniref:Universal stress protein UspA n=1 Tax=Salinarimonas ramus TaxID=690164 RepID=A0A917QBJ4_9HYPH|nr:universal stress protein [Salinarimonas ramus]GGK41978.1 universal stress protein UspA [Salinarimonas ramus]
MYRNILLAVDLGHKDAERRAVETVVEYARAFGSTIHLMTVVPDFGMPLVGGFFPEGFEKDALDRANQELHAYAAQMIPSEIPQRTIVGHGGIYREILHWAQETAADVIVMSAHRPELEDYLLGPNAARVVRHAKTSVLVVRPRPA